MLQINIKHNDDSTVKVESIMNVLNEDTFALAHFDSLKGSIELDVCKPFIGQEIRVRHKFEDSFQNYTVRALLESVDFDPKTNIKSISYQALETIE